MGVINFKETTMFKKAFQLVMDVYEISKSFPPEEKYSLTDQIRRSSRCTCANLAEAYRKRQYQAPFVAKISDCDMENSETQVWLLFSLNCKYIHQSKYNQLLNQSEVVGKLLYHMIQY